MRKKYISKSIALLLGGVSLFTPLREGQASMKDEIIDLKLESESTSSVSSAPLPFLNLVDYFTKNKAHFRIVKHKAEGKCELVSDLRGSTLDQSAKAIVVSARVTKKKRAYYLLALKATQMVDFDKVKVLSGARSVRMAQPEKAKELTGCVMGSIPPFSFHKDLQLVVDPGLVNSSNKEIAFNAGSLNHSIFLNLKDYQSLISGAKIKSISKK